MKIAKTMVTALVALGGIYGAIADELKVTDISKPAKATTLKIGTLRSAPYKVSKFPKEFNGLTCIVLPRGDGKKPGLKFSFKINKPATIYLFAHKRGVYAPEGWKKTDMTAQWLVGKGVYKDLIFEKDFPAGKVEIPAHTGSVKKNTPPYGVPNMAVIKTK